MKTAREPDEARDEAEPPEKAAEKSATRAAEKAEKAEKSAEKAEQSEKAAAAEADRATGSEPKPRLPSQLDDLLITVRRLEAFALEEAKRVSDKVLPLAESKARQSIWVSLIFALGLGLILGLWLNGRRRD